jgi:hypothetical protein
VAVAAEGRTEDVRIAAWMDPKGVLTHLFLLHAGGWKDGCEAFAFLFVCEVKNSERRGFLPEKNGGLAGFRRRVGRRSRVSELGSSIDLVRN